MNPELFAVPVERGRNLEGFLTVVDGLSCLTLGLIYETEEAVTLTDPEFITFQEEIERL